MMVKGEMRAIAIDASVCVAVVGYSHLGSPAIRVGEGIGEFAADPVLHRTSSSA